MECIFCNNMAVENRELCQTCINIGNFLPARAMPQITISEIQVTYSANCYTIEGE